VSQATPVDRRGLRRKLLRRFVVFPALMGVTVIAVLTIFENRLVYFPTPAAKVWAEPERLTKRDVDLDIEGVPIHAWWCPKEGATGALLYCHGNAGNLCMLADVYRQLQEELNVSVMAFDYPGFGRSGGSPSERGCYDSALAAYDWMKGQGIAGERITLYGDSLGGGVAAEVAWLREHRALVLFSSYTSVPDVGHDQYPFLPARTLMRNRFETLRKLPDIRGPVFIAHGAVDDLISISHARRLHDAANEPKALHIDPDRGHETTLTREFLAALRAFIESNAP
jgi:uncharacterized protein